MSWMERSLLECETINSSITNNSLYPSPRLLTYSLGLHNTSADVFGNDSDDVFQYAMFPWRFLCKPIQYDYSFVMYGVLCPLLGVLTLIGNVLAIGIFTVNRRMRSPTATLLIGLAVSDVMAATVITPMYVYFYSLGKSRYLISFPLCIYHSYAYKLAVVFHTTSVWLTTALGVQRCIVVAYPLPGRQLCTHNNSRMLVSAVYVAAVIVYVPWFISDRFESFTFEDEYGTPIHSCLCTKADIVLLSDEKTYKTIRLILGQSLPCFLLVFTTIILVRKLTVQSSRILQLHALDDTDTERRDFRHIRRTTVMVVLIVFCFLCVEIPLGVVLSLDLSNTNILPLDVKKKMAVFLNFFTYVNYHINFWIYVLLSKSFRQSLRKILHLEKCFRRCFRNRRNMNFPLDNSKCPLSNGETRTETKMSLM